MKIKDKKKKMEVNYGISNIVDALFVFTGFILILNGVFKESLIAVIAGFFVALLRWEIKTPSKSSKKVKGK